MLATLIWAMPPKRLGTTALLIVITYYLSIIELLVAICYRCCWNVAINGPAKVNLENII